MSQTTDSTENAGQPFILKSSSEAISQAAGRLRAGQLVGMPTETVYGLAAAINSEEALRSVFVFKRRPFEDPLIVHVQSLADALPLWQLNALAKTVVQCLAQAFWPGPLTIVAPAASHVSRLLSGGGDTVGVRAPNHPIARALIEASGIALAAPSANVFGHISPTRAQHVVDDFTGRDLLVLDGDDCTIGIESTVVQLGLDGSLQLLRHGVIHQDQLTAALKKAGLEPLVTSKKPGQLTRKISAPGQYLRHYAPHTPAFILSAIPISAGEFNLKEKVPLHSTACLDFAGRFEALRCGFAEYRDLSPSGKLAEATQSLFRELRQLETTSAERFLLLPEFDWRDAQEGALFDRIFRAAEGKRAFIENGFVCLS